MTCEEVWTSPCNCCVGRARCGSRNIANDPRNRRDWALTAVWAYSMDFVAAGLIFMVLSSIWLWLKRPGKLLPGAVCLALGSLLCGLFCFGLRWMF